MVKSARFMLFLSLSFSMSHADWRFIEHDDICDLELNEKCTNDADVVKHLQKRLNLKINANLRADGEWGEGTKEAVITFQKKYHLTPADGWVGKATKRQLDNVDASLHKPALSNARYPKYSFLDYDDICDLDLNEQCSNDMDLVKHLQKTLNEKIHADLKVDGKWGEGTKQAVITFQKKYHLNPADGWVGKATKRKLDNVDASLLKPTISPKMYDKHFFLDHEDICDLDLNEACTNEEELVKHLQKTLNNKLNRDLKVDGKWGKGTKEAVVDFQKKFHLFPADGWVGKSTKKALDNSSKTIHTTKQKKKHKIGNRFTSYQSFRQNVNLRKSFEVYKDSALLRKAGRRNTKVKIDVSEQRVRLYVNNKVALDSPCTTGAKHKFEPNTKIYRDKHTPLGTFRILEKIVDKRSTIFGELYRNGKKIYHGDRRKYRGSWSGVRYVGASLKNWMRLTSGGIGLHASKYVKRYPGTNGCIRLPYNVSKEIFKHVRRGTKVSVVP